MRTGGAFSIEVRRPFATRGP